MFPDDFWENFVDVFVLLNRATNGRCVAPAAETIFARFRSTKTSTKFSQQIIWEYTKKCLPTFKKV